MDPYFIASSKPSPLISWGYALVIHTSKANGSETVSSEVWITGTTDYTILMAPEKYLSE